MAWLKIDDQFADHPKIVQAGPLASWLHMTAMCYAARYLTDGFVPRKALPRMVDFSGVTQDGTPIDVGTLAAQLVTAGLWAATETGWQIHDYLEYNPSRAQVLGERAAARERVADTRAKQIRQSSGVFGECSPEVRPNIGQSSGDVTPLPIPLPIPSSTTATVRHIETDPDVTRLFTLINRAGIVLGGDLQAERWRSLLDVTRDMALVGEAFDVAAEQPRQPNVGYIRSILERCIAEGCRPGERRPGGDGHGARAAPDPPPKPRPRGPITIFNPNTQRNEVIGAPDNTSGLKPTTTGP